MTPDRLASSPFAVSYATSGALGANVDFSALGYGICRAIRVGQGGDIVLTMARDSTAVTFYSVQDGETIYVQALGITASGTTAQKITVLW